MRSLLYSTGMIVCALLITQTHAREFGACTGASSFLSDTECVSRLPARTHHARTLPKVQAAHTESPDQCGDACVLCLERKVAHPKWHGQIRWISQCVQHQMSWHFR